MCWYQVSFFRSCQQPLAQKVQRARTIFFAEAVEQPFGAPPHALFKSAPNVENAHAHHHHRQIITTTTNCSHHEPSPAKNGGHKTNCSAVDTAPRQGPRQPYQGPPQQAHRLRPRHRQGGYWVSDSGSSSTLTATVFFLTILSSLAPYERRVVELLRNNKDKRARKFAKKRVSNWDLFFPLPWPCVLCTDCFIP